MQRTLIRQGYQLTISIHTAGLMIMNKHPIMLNDSLTIDYNEKHGVDSEFDSRLVIPEIDTLYIEIEQRRFYNMCQL